MHGTAIGQVLLDAGYIEDVMENQGDFVDGNSLYRFCSVLPNQSNNVKNINTKSKVYGSSNSNYKNIMIETYNNIELDLLNGYVSNMMYAHPKHKKVD